MGFGDIQEGIQEREHPLPAVESQFDLFVAKETVFWACIIEGSAVGNLLSTGPIIAIGHVHCWTQGEMHPPSWSLFLVLSGSIGEQLTGCHIDQFAHPWVFKARETVPHVANDRCLHKIGRATWSTRMRLTSKSPISRDRMRASRCGCSVRVGSTGGKMIVSSMGGLGHLKSDKPWIIGRSFSYDMERGVRSGLSGRLGPPVFDRTASAGPESIDVLFVSSGAQAGGEYFAQQRVVANVERHELSIMHDMVEGKGVESMSSSLLLMEPMVARLGGFFHLVAPLGANERSAHGGDHRSELSSRGARGMGVCGSCGLTLYVSRITPTVPGYIDFGSDLEFATWPLERWRQGGPDVEAWMRSTAFSSLNLSVS
ncbi:hypothetical protein CK203_105522 [Vitis vinifera]|uniref:Uncharacterized protein n=1 Tax=Vitis vinifera TaxID=29760 RepID=A0A438FGN0_VITVI|nr:hypothetical protein CK203_105522 [Vitis vinifera]